GVSGRELDLCREQSRISPDSFGIHGHTRIPQDGLSQTAAGRCPSVVVPRDSFPTLSSVAVGTGIAPRPPHGPGRARLTHPVLIAGKMRTDRGSHEHPL